jgi:ribosomal protein L25 (general stress protein Ctc)
VAPKASKPGPKASKNPEKANTAAAIIFDKTKRNSNQILKNQTIDKMFVASKKVVEDIDESSDDGGFIEK